MASKKPPPPGWRQVLSDSPGRRDVVHSAVGTYRGVGRPLPLRGSRRGAVSERWAIGGHSNEKAPAAGADQGRFVDGGGAGNVLLYRRLPGPARPRPGCGAPAASALRRSLPCTFVEMSSPVITETGLDIHRYICSGWFGQTTCQNTNSLRAMNRQRPKAGTRSSAKAMSG